MTAPTRLKKVQIEYFVHPITPPDKVSTTTSEDSSDLRSASRMKVSDLDLATAKSLAEEWMHNFLMQVPEYAKSHTTATDKEPSDNVAPIETGKDKTAKSGAKNAAA